MKNTTLAFASISFAILLFALISLLFGVVSAQTDPEQPKASTPPVENRNLAVSVATPEQSDQKVALVIGNSNYKSSPLKNPVNDARAMSAKLKELGFEVIAYENLQQKQLGKVLREFRSRLKPGAVALFFYAGHGLQVKGVNYLPTVDADIESEDDVSLASLDVNKVFDVMAEAKTRLNLVFLDACRNNPYTRSFRSAEGGLAKVSAPSGTLISFATRPGSVARDGDGKNGLYTANLLSAMDVPNLPIEKLVKRVVTGVKQGSKGAQEPWSEGSIEGDFYFRGGAQSEEAIEKSYWKSIKDSPVQANFDAYLTTYPNGLFVNDAKEIKARLEKEAQEEELRRKEEELHRKEEAKHHEEQKKLMAEEKNKLAEEKLKIKEREKALKDSPSKPAKTIVVPMSF